MKTLILVFPALGLLAIATLSGCGGSQQDKASIAVPSIVPSQALSRNSDGTIDRKGLATSTGESPQQLLSYIGESLPGTPENDLSAANLAQEIDMQVSIQCDDSKCTVQSR